MKYRGLGEPMHMGLMAALMIVEQAFNETPYMVGSATQIRNFRDVDVRLIMNDDKFDILFGDTGGHTTAFWTLTCISISAWLKQCTGLPVDFQIQRRSRVKESDWDKERDPLMINEYDNPEWSKKRGS